MSNVSYPISPLWVRRFVSMMMAAAAPIAACCQGHGSKRDIRTDGFIQVKGERLDLRLSGLGCDWADWFTVLEAAGLDRVLLPILQCQASGATAGGGTRPAGPLEGRDAGPRAPAAGGAEAAVAPRGTLVWMFQAPGPPAAGTEDQAGALNFVRLMARSMA